MTFAVDNYGDRWRTAPHERSHDQRRDIGATTWPAGARTAQQAGGELEGGGGASRDPLAKVAEDRIRRGAGEASHGRAPWQSAGRRRRGAPARLSVAASCLAACVMLASIAASTMPPARPLPARAPRKP